VLESRVFVCLVAPTEPFLALARELASIELDNQVARAVLQQLAH
jgi:hypothetical protein